MVSIHIDGVHEVTLNDPSDAADWLITCEGLPHRLFDKSPLDAAPSWADLPLAFYWGGRRFDISSTRG